MTQFDLKGEVLGYKKSTLLITAFSLLLIGVSFYAGAKYEKIKLSKLGLLVDKKAIAMEKKTKTKQQKQLEGQQQAEKNQTESINGKIVSKNAEGVLTIVKTDITKQEALLTADTKIGENGNGSSAQLYIGQQIIANGTKNAEGNLILSDVKPVVTTKSSLVK